MAKRQSLSSFSPKVGPTGANVVKMEAAAAPHGREKYHSVTVYLTADEVRTLKLIALDNNRRLSDVVAVPIREWLERNGHARSTASKV